MEHVHHPKARRMEPPAETLAISLKAAASCRAAIRDIQASIEVSRRSMLESMAVVKAVATQLSTLDQLRTQRDERMK